MIKFDFIINSDIETNIVKQEICKKTSMLKFHVLVGNELNQIQTVSNILKSSFISEKNNTQLLHNRNGSLNTSLCRIFLTCIKNHTLANVIRVNLDNPYMCLYNENDSIIASTGNNEIHPISLMSKSIVSFNFLRNINYNQSDITQRLLNEIYSIENQLFYTLLKEQKPIEQHDISVNSIVENLFDSISNISSYRLQPTHVLMHPIMSRYLCEPQYSTAIRLSPTASMVTFGVPLTYSNIIDQNEIYILSSDLGCMYIFDDIQFTNNELFDIASYRFLITEKINLAITRNFTKIRIC